MAIFAIKPKKGEVRSDGMIFAGFSKTCKNGEWWITPEMYEKRKQMFRDSKKKEYSKNREKILARSSKWYYDNREEHLKFRREKYKQNPEKHKSASLELKYGITMDEYNKMLESQKGVCFICSMPCKSGRSLSVDHCHKTGKVRGLLCVSCNNGLGRFNDSIELLQKSINYLEKFQSINN